MLSELFPSTIYLTSNDSSYTLTNTGSDFTNCLPRPICTEEGCLEVGISKIFYVPRQQTENIFENVSESTIQVTNEPTETIVVTIKKISDQINTFFMFANARFILMKVDALFTQLHINGNPFVILNNNTNKNIYLPRDLAQSLGFDDIVFPQGDHQSNRPASPLLFASLPNDILFQILIATPVQVQQAIVNEPTEKNIQYLAQAIANALRTLNVTFTLEGNSVVISSQESNQLVRFSSKIAHLFGLPVNVEIKAAAVRLPINPFLDLNSHIVCISSDICEPTSFGSQTATFMEMFKLSNEYGNYQEKCFNPIVYHNISRPFIQTVNITLTNQHGKHLNFGSEEVIVVLRLRRT